MAAVVGREGRDLAAEEAPDYIAGYTVLNDWSARDLWRQEQSLNMGPAKGKDFATSFGPYLVTPDELAEKRIGTGAEERFDLQMTGRINGDQLTSDNAQNMYYTFPQMMERASQHVRLRPGDIIGSGTCGTGCILELGTERHPWLLPGDVIEMEIERLGTLRNTLVRKEERLVMPMPTPPGPGEEPENETELYRYHLRRLVTWFIEALDPLPPEAFSWRPPLPEANSLAAISLHAVTSAEWWVLSCVGEASLERDRADEFATQISWAELRPRYSAFLAEGRDALGDHERRGSGGDQPASRGQSHEPALPDPYHRASGAPPWPYRDHSGLVEGDTSGDARGSSTVVPRTASRLRIFFAFLPVDLCQQLPIRRRELQLREKVRAEEPCSAQRLLTAPPGDGAVVAAQKDLRNPPATKLYRPRVVRIFEQSIAKGLLDGGAGGEHTRYQTAYRIYQHHRRQLAAGQHEVAQRDLIRDQMLAYPLIQALIVAAE